MPIDRNKKKKYFLILILLVLVILVFGWVEYKNTISKKTTPLILFPVTRGNLEITVLEGGSVEAKESLEIKSEVQGETKILSIVEEGYYITPEDVKNGKILVELDAKKLLDQQTEQELRYQNAKASLADAQEQYEIQKNQNEIDIRQAELDVKFARMDVEKYLGIKTTEEIFKQIGITEDNLKKIFESASKEPDAVQKFVNSEENTTENYIRKSSHLGNDDRSNNLAGKSKLIDHGEDNSNEIEKNISNDNDIGENRSIDVGENDSASVLISLITTGSVDFRKYADPSLLGDGEAQQTLQKYTTDSILAEEDLKLAQKKLEGTRRLYEKAFVTQTDLETDELTLKRKQVALEQSNNNKSLYIQYEFPKQAERLVAAYIQALWKYIRIQKLAKSRLAQAEAKLNSAKAQFTLESRKKREIEEQIEKCTIRATKPGLVVYGGSDDRFMQDRIQEGATVRERQIIITIPDTTVMRVRTKIHESNIKRIMPGQKARIRVDAYPEEELFGTVEKVSVLPNAQNRWLNPDLKVYDTFVVIEGTHPWLKPGMTAQVEIIVSELNNVLYIPLQSVINIDGKQACYVQKGDKTELRFITTGEYSDSFIEVKDGLKEGEMVLLRYPTESTGAPSEKPRKNDESRKKSITENS